MYITYTSQTTRLFYLCKTLAVNLQSCAIIVQSISNDALTMDNLSIAWDYYHAAIASANALCTEIDRELFKRTEKASALSELLNIPSQLGPRATIMWRYCSQVEKEEKIVKEILSHQSYYSGGYEQQENLFHRHKRSACLQGHNLMFEYQEVVDDAISSIFKADKFAEYKHFLSKERSSLEEAIGQLHDPTSAIDEKAAG